MEKVFFKMVLSWIWSTVGSLHNWENFLLIFQMRKLNGTRSDLKQTTLMMSWEHFKETQTQSELIKYLTPFNDALNISNYLASVFDRKWRSIENFSMLFNKPLHRCKIKLNTDFLYSFHYLFFPFELSLIWRSNLNN